MKIPCSDYVKTNGVFFFARMLDKIRLHAQGSLPSDYNVGFSDPTCLDARFCRFLGLDHDALTQRTLAGGTNEEILEWSFQNSRRPNEEEILFWNSYVTKTGWRDESSEELQSVKQALGWGNRSEIKTWLDFHAVDEERDPKRTDYSS
jgi:gluconokinase